MSVVEVTTCDRCNPERSVSHATGRGYVHFGPGIAVQDCGWKRVRGEGHVCDRCTDEEEVAKESRRRQR